MDEIQRLEVARLTEEYGGAWGICHTRRLLHLIEIIGAGLDYDHDVVWLAAHLHDWGAYDPWRQDGVDHALRSRQVAENYLREKGYPAEPSARILEAIALHHQTRPERCIEAVLLCDADALDFLGVIGALRDFVKKPKDLRGGYNSVVARKEKAMQVICLEKSKAIAAQRLQETEALLAALMSESFGHF